MAWPTKTLIFEEYPGWEVEILPLSVRDVDEIGNSKAEGGSTIDAYTSVVLPVIKRWNFTDKEGEELPISQEGIKKAPIVLVNGILSYIFEQMNATPIPKETSTSK